MSVFVLKVIAMGTMLIDHIGYRLAGNPMWMRVIGRTAFILYAFLMAESYCHLKDNPQRLKRHVGKLLLLCLVSEIPYDLCTSKKLFDISTQSVIFTLTGGFLALILSGMLIKKLRTRGTAAIAGSAVICILLAYLTYLIRSDAGFFGVLLIVLFYLYLRGADSMGMGARAACLAGIYAAYAAIYIWTQSSFGGWTQITETAYKYRCWLLGMPVPFLIALFYNRKLGRRSRGFNLVYSWFYPAHMVVLYLIWRFIL